jgi:cytochrome c-type biogenesis protein
MVTLFLGLLSGVLATLSPCILPLLPIVLACALAEHRFGALALIAGLVLSFTATGLAVAGVVNVLDVSPDVMRTVAAVLLVTFGTILLSSTLQARLSQLGGPFSGALSMLATRFEPKGPGGQFGLGALLGAAWTPCAGPTLGAAVSLAAASGTALRAAGIMAMFSLGAALPLLALGYGSRKALQSRRVLLANIARIALPLLGAVLTVLGALILLGADRNGEAALLGVMPEWLLRLTTQF